MHGGRNTSTNPRGSFLLTGLSDVDASPVLTDRLFPGRFVHYMNLDYAGWDQADFSERAVRQIEEGHRLGAAGFKEYKRLGLYLRDGAGKLIRIDDPKLDRVWKRCGELGLPVSIHVADPQAFWLPYNEQNERWNDSRTGGVHAGPPGFPVEWDQTRIAKRVSLRARSPDHVRTASRTRLITLHGFGYHMRWERTTSRPSTHTVSSPMPPRSRVTSAPSFFISPATRAAIADLTIQTGQCRMRTRFMGEPPSSRECRVRALPRSGPGTPWIRSPPASPSWPAQASRARR